MSDQERDTEYVRRLEHEIARQPVFDKYPPEVDLDFAIRVALETVEEMQWGGDEHNWCHQRPILLTLLKAAIQNDCSRAPGEEKR